MKKGASINSERDRLRVQIRCIKTQIAGNSGTIAKIRNADAADLGLKMCVHELIEVPTSLFLL